MGLDQFLSVKSATNETNAGAVREALGFGREEYPCRVEYTTEVAYWRKCYAISSWFQNHCQWNESTLSCPVIHAHLELLVNHCRQALAGDVDQFDVQHIDSERLHREWSDTITKIENVLAQFPATKYNSPTFVYEEAP